VTDAQGSVIARMDYGPFGEPVGGSKAGDFGFAGHRGEPGTGLVFMGSRIYDPILARFLAPDPLIPSPILTQALNRYAYVYNDPLSFVDPSGNEPIDINRTYQTSPSPDPKVDFLLDLHLAKPPSAGWDPWNWESYKEMLHGDYWRTVNEQTGWYLNEYIPTEQRNWDLIQPFLEKEWEESSTLESQMLTKEHYVERRIGARPNRLGIAWTLAKLYIPAALFGGEPAPGVSRVSRMGPPQQIRGGIYDVEVGIAYKVGKAPPAPHDIVTQAWDLRQGTTMRKWAEISGEMTEAQQSMSYPWKEWSAHTEYKALTRLHLTDSTVVYLRGFKEPCSACIMLMQGEAERTGALIIYSWGEGVRIFSRILK